MITAAPVAEQVTELRVVFGQAWQLSRRLERLLASAAESMPMVQRTDVRIAGALAGSLSDQLEALVRSGAA